ncbi:hypothetical protein NN561_011281 [Cricetulus griseus]
MAAEASTAGFTASCAHIVGSKSGPLDASECQCTRCGRTVSVVSGEEPGVLGVPVEYGTGGGRAGVRPSVGVVLGLRGSGRECVRGLGHLDRARAGAQLCPSRLSPHARGDGDTGALSCCASRATAKSLEHLPQVGRLTKERAKKRKVTTMSFSVDISFVNSAY